MCEGYTVPLMESKPSIPIGVFADVYGVPRHELEVNPEEYTLRLWHDEGEWHVEPDETRDGGGNWDEEWAPADDEQAHQVIVEDLRRREQLNSQIPVTVTMLRGDLSVSEAIVYWLCDDEDGPELTQQEAAEKMGASGRDEVWTQLRRARDKLTTG